MMSHKGFGLSLTADEYNILSAFSVNRTVTYPLGSLSIRDTNACIQSLKRKQVIKGNGPYTLTKKGIRFIADYNKEQQQEQ